MLKKYNLKKVLLIGGLFIILLLTFYSVGLFKKAKIAHNNANKINNISVLTSELITTVQDYILFETRDVEYFETKKSINLSLQDELILRTGNILKSVDKNNFQKSNINDEIIQISTEIKNYNRLSSLLSFKILERGFKDYGLIGEMRESIHFVEQHIKPEYKPELLMIRRHEKDYLLRNQDDYVSLVHQKVNFLLKKPLKNNVRFALQNYIIFFDKVVQIDKQIGAANNTGIMHNIKKSNYRLHNQLNMLSKHNHDFLAEELLNIEKTFINIILLSVFIITINLIINVLSVLRGVNFPSNTLLKTGRL